MRRTGDRIRHAVLFEVIALILVVPAGGTFFEVPYEEFGVVALVSTFVAMAWNVGFNLAFDHAMLRMNGTVRKSVAVRLAHAVLFEIGLTCLLVPFIAWYLDIPLWQALVMDVSLIAFYAVFAFAFNWAYDVAFPVEAKQ